MGLSGVCLCYNRRDADAIISVIDSQFLSERHGLLASPSQLFGGHAQQPVPSYRCNSSWFVID